MIPLLAQATPGFWTSPFNSGELWTRIVIALLIGVAGLIALLYTPLRMRMVVVSLATFLSGLFYVAFYLWPKPIDRQPGELPLNAVEGVGFWLSDSVPVVADFTNILTGLLLGLGVYSLIRVHGRRLIKGQKDWVFSATLLVSMIAMVIFGYADFLSRQGENAARLDNPANWGFWNYGRDLLFDGLLQQMDAAMFSIIAFYILSAAYRAFRVRSVEATILLATALIVMLSLMGAVEFAWNEGINAMAQNNQDAFIQNFRLTEIATWLRGNVQTPALRGIDFGIGIGALAMGLRLWLSLEKQGVS